MNGQSVAEAKGFVYEPVRGPKRIEAVWTGCQWRVTGREVVTTMRRI